MKNKKRFNKITLAFTMILCLTNGFGILSPIIQASSEISYEWEEEFVL